MTGTLNEYTQAGSQTPQYDADCNGHTYVYDEENRLIEIDNSSLVGGVMKTVNVYDGLSRRVEKGTYDGGGSLVATTWGRCWMNLARAIDEDARVW